MRVGRNPIRRNTMGPYFCASVANLRQAGMFRGPGNEHSDHTTSQPIGPGGNLDHLLITTSNVWAASKHIVATTQILAAKQHSVASEKILTARQPVAVTAHVRYHPISGLMIMSSSLLPFPITSSLSMLAVELMANQERQVPSLISSPMSTRRVLRSVGLSAMDDTNKWISGTAN